MRKCNVTKRSVSGSEAVADQPGTPETVLLRTNPTVSLETMNEGEKKNFGECVMPDESEKSYESKQVKVKKQANGKNKSNDMRGMKKSKWTREERLVLWECFVRSKKVSPNGYIKTLVELWETNGLGVRSQASLLSQVKSIQNGKLLSEFEKREVERRVEEECEYDNELEEDDLCANVSSSSGEVGVDFLVECESISGEKRVCDEIEGQLSGQSASVRVNRLDCVEDGEGVRKLTADETSVLERLREVFFSEESHDIPSLKGHDRKTLIREVNLVNRVTPNLKLDRVDVTSVNRLLYAGSFVVCERLGLMKKRKKVLKSRKPWWQRRLEASIVQWRKDLGRLNEIKHGVNLKTKVMNELNRR